VPLGLGEWLRVFGVAFGLLLTVEAGKWLNNRRYRPFARATGVGEIAVKGEE
jgi:hypothetical protein